MKIYFLLIAVLGFSPLFAQNDIPDLMSNMAYYGDIVMNAVATDHRGRANDSLLVTVDRFLNEPKAFTQSLDKVPWLSVVMDSSMTFRIITWQLNKGDSSFVYFGRIQFKTGETIALEDKKETSDPLYYSGDANNWYGARYGKLVQFKHHEEIAYLLLGFNAHSEWNRQKVVDVLTFDNGQPSFGLPVFIEEGQDADREGRYRLLLTYSRDIRVNLEFNDDKKMIIHDHLIPMHERFLGQGATFVTDGSYEAYKLNENGHLVYKEKLFNTIIDEPLDDGKDRSSQPKKDIFGRDRQ